MTAGELRNRVMFERQVGGDHDFDGVTFPWVVEFLAWASIQPQTSSDVLSDESEDRVTRYRIRIRYDSRFTSAMRIRWGKRLFNIDGAINIDERDRYIQIDAVELESWQQQ